MEMNFREYAEGFWGPGLGALGGWLLGGGTPLSWPLAAAGAYAGHRAQNWYQDLDDPSRRYNQVDPKNFVYYRDIDGRVQKELLPNENGYNKENTPQSYEHKNNDRNHPYFYYWDDRKNKIVKKIKAGYQAYQRRSRYGAGGYGGYGRQQQRRRKYGH